jgi:hypothetical protein
LLLEEIVTHFDQDLPYVLESNPHPNLIRTQFLAIS